MHLLYLIDELIARAGTEKHLLALAEGMVSLGHKVTVVSWMDGPFAASFKNNQHLTYRCLNAPRIYDLKGLTAFGALTAYIRNKKVDILQSFHTGSDIVAPIAALLSGQRVSVVSSRRDLGFTKSGRHLRVQRILNCRVDGILANSIAVKRAVAQQEGYPQSKTYVIYNGIDLRPFQEERAAPDFLLPIIEGFEEPFVIGTLGNLKEHKGHEFLIDVFTRVARHTPNVVLTIAGDGPLLGGLKGKCASLGVEDRVFFLGSIADVAGFLGNIHLYVHPSDSEGFSNALVEAMAAGRVIVATDAGGNSEIITPNKNGFLAKYGDVEGMAEQIELAMSTPNRGEISRSNRQTARLRYSLDQMLARYERFYKQIHSFQEGRGRAEEAAL